MSATPVPEVCPQRSSRRNQKANPNTETPRHGEAKNLKPPMHTDQFTKAQNRSTIHPFLVLSGWIGVHRWFQILLSFFSVPPCLRG
jgi:hypothetical protein